ncbi:MAG: PhzF family phenazine biosynthesis protein [Actinomycetes bacterium]
MNEPRTSVPFFLVDVFASAPLSGNPLSLVPDADELSESQMRSIAREFNQSETTFLLRPRLPGASFRLRSFTPIGAEVLGAGHNALGAWLWLSASGRLPASRDALAQEIGDQVLPVQVTSEADGSAVVSMNQSPPRFGGTVSDRAELADALGLSVQDLADDPAQVVDTGAGHLLVPVRDRAAVDRAEPDASRLAAVLHKVDGEGCYLYSLDPVDPRTAVAYTRFFNPSMGISEDPATGTAAGPLAALLLAGGRVIDGTWGIEQGRALGRPSLIRVTIDGQDVSVSGSGLVVAEGTLFL